MVWKLEKSIKLSKSYKNVEILWASVREPYNYLQAKQLGCHIITETNDILKKLELSGKNLETFSQETVQMFFDDANEAGFQL